MPQLKTPVTVRLNPDLLAEVRESAARDNRSLTNFIETALRERIEVSSNRARVRSPPARSVKEVKSR
jgi:hypothetical protein